MTFSIKKLQVSDLDRIYKFDENEVGAAVQYRRFYWGDDMRRGSWLVDEQADEFLLSILGTRENNRIRYIFGAKEGVVAFQEKEYCVFSLLYASPSLAYKMDAVLERAREAFRVGGLFADGFIPDDAFAVPHAQFTKVKGD